MFIMIDNYDSFVHILAMYFKELGADIKVIRNNKVTVEYLESLYNKRELTGIIISPGPKSPKDAGMSIEIVAKFGHKVPILGVCLGHQVIGVTFGAAVSKGKRPMHGKVTAINHSKEGVFKELPQKYKVTRYHSLVVEKENLPKCLKVEAFDDMGVIMGIRHTKYPIYGIQFHPEAALTEYGHDLIENYIMICKEWWREHEDTC